MNACSEALFPNAEIDVRREVDFSRLESLLFRKVFKALKLTYSDIYYNNDSEEFCSFVLKIVAIGLVNKLRSFKIFVSLKTESEFYVMNKLLWNVGTIFENIVNSSKHFEENNTLKKNFLWLLNKKKK
eukprot:snap_masked-scaffold_17-processed-gene-2.32-mRNA-1 protein AED:1.00 eAED:1.00 QI:0/0/0/0/1/1/2/0/127